MELNILEYEEYREKCDRDEVILGVIDKQDTEILKTYNRTIRNGRLCIRKLYHDNITRNVEEMARLHMRLQELQHEFDDFLKHTAEIYEVFMVKMQDGSLSACILEEYIQGETIAEKLKKKQADFERHPGEYYSDHKARLRYPPRIGFDEDKVIDIMIQLCNVLEIIDWNKPSIVHRDIKATNIMITDYGDVCKLIDFDISRIRNHSFSQTEDTYIAFTPGFGAPEQYGIEETGPETDIYAIGVLMHLMLVGYDEHEYVMRGRPFFGCHKRIKYHGTLRDIIDKCTQASMEDRYRNPWHLEIDLRQAKHDSCSFLACKEKYCIEPLHWPPIKM